MLMQQREEWIGYGSYRAPSSSIAPTVDAGDFIAVDTRSSTLGSLHVGDVVIVESEQKPGEILLRRIVATGGQHVVIGEDGAAHAQRSKSSAKIVSWNSYAPMS